MKNKKDDETKVLNKALDLIKRSKEIPIELKDITNYRNISKNNQERPDFVLENKDGIKIGIEHFLVDESAQENKKGFDSGTKKLDGLKNAALKQYNYKGEHEPDSKDYENLKRTVNQVINNVINFSFTKNIKAFQQTFDKHYKNISSYKENIDNDFSHVKIIFLIEYIYMSDKYMSLTGNKNIYPIWDDWIKILEKAKTRKIKQFIIYFRDYKNISEDYVITFTSKGIKKQLDDMNIPHYKFISIFNDGWSKYIKKECHINEDGLFICDKNKRLSDRETKRLQKDFVLFMRKVKFEKQPCALTSHDYDILSEFEPFKNVTL